MISEKKNNDLVKEILNRSFTFDIVNDQKTNDSSTTATYIEEVIQMIYPRDSNILPIEKADDIFVWLNDEKYLSTLGHRACQWQKDKKKVHVISSCQKKLGIKCVNEYQLNKKTEGILALGYLDFVLNIQEYTPSYIPETDRTFDSFKQMIREYSIQRVSNETGLSVYNVKKLYDEIRSSNQSYQWLALDTSDRTEIDIQIARVICLIPAIDPTICEFDFIPLSYEQRPFEKTFAVLSNENQKTLILGNEIIAPFKEKLLPVSSRESVKKGIVSFYDWDFADYFDVDPLPSMNR